MVLSTNHALRRKQALKIRCRINPVLLGSISHQREALYLYRVKLRSTGPRLDYSPEGGLISLPDRPHLKRQYADETVRTKRKLSQGESRRLFLFLFYFILFFYFFGLY